ncbi:MAG: hypothetical protein ACI8PZ_002197 [Myxococcota bacterium]|jgi:hypothetical protein
MRELSWSALGLVALAAWLTACGGDEAPSPDPAPATAAEAVPEAPAAPATPDDPGLDKSMLEAGNETVALVPSPVETQRALADAGIETKLDSLIPKHEFDIQNADTDHAAVRTGVLLADALLTVKSADQKDLLQRLTGVQRGLKQLGGGSDIDAMLNDIKDRIKADAVTRDELLKEFDELSGAVIPELEFNGQERVVPLIQAGSWLEGSNLVAKAIQAKGAGSAEAADRLLKQPAVVAYFISYVQNEGAEKAPAAVTARLQESLTKLQELAEKTEPLGAEDITTVITVTDNVLTLL